MSEFERCMNELRLAGLLAEDSDFDGELGKSVARLLVAHFVEEHSGYSSLEAAKIFYSLIAGNFLSPLQGTPEEWLKLEEGTYPEAPDSDKPLTYQNLRCNSVFKTEDGDAYFFAPDRTMVPIKFPFRIKMVCLRDRIDK